MSDDVELLRRVYALFNGRMHLSIEDIEAVAPAVLRHRIILNFDAHADGENAETILTRLIPSVKSQGSVASSRPCGEMFAHIGNQKRVYRALADCGRLNDFFDLAQGYFARGIEQRFAESGRLQKCPRHELGARASALAGSLLSLLRWWLDRGAKEPPRAMDELFHRMVWSGLQ